jgi:hypothetical protein
MLSQPAHLPPCPQARQENNRLLEDVQEHRVRHYTVVNDAVSHGQQADWQAGSMPSYQLSYQCCCKHLVVMVPQHASSMPAVCFLTAFAVGASTGAACC